MSLSARSRLLSLTWLLVPTLLWSFFLHVPALCIDPLIFPALEQRISPKLVFFCRLIWVVIFAMTLLLAWNIWPSTYSFYLHEALPFTPRSVLGGLGAAAVLLIWFLLLSNIPQRMGQWYIWVFSVGIILFSMKALAVLGVVYAPSVRQHIKSPLLANVHLLLSAVGTHRNKVKDADETPQSTFYSFVQHQEALPSEIVLMVVESWGEKRDTLTALANDIQNQGFQLKKYGFASYRGSTLSGEFRELCSKYVQPSGELMDEMEILYCAPRYLSDKGYQAIGVHGYQGSFYARSSFWTRFGIKNQVFSEKLQNQPHCPGFFPAACDENLIQFSVDLLNNSEKPAFLYILTISSHEPIDPAALNHGGKYFNEIKVDHPTQIVNRRAISALIARLQARKSPGCTLVYIAGDHQPPSASAQGNIFEAGKVPFIAFTQDCPAGRK